MNISNLQEVNDTIKHYICKINAWYKAIISILLVGVLERIIKDWFEHNIDIISETLLS